MTWRLVFCRGSSQPLICQQAASLVAAPPRNAQNQKSCKTKIHTKDGEVQTEVVESCPYLLLGLTPGSGQPMFKHVYSLLQATPIGAVWFSQLTRSAPPRPPELSLRHRGLRIRCQVAFRGPWKQLFCGALCVGLSWASLFDFLSGLAQKNNKLSVCH